MDVYFADTGSASGSQIGLPGGFRPDSFSREKIQKHKNDIICYAIVLLGRTSGFRAGNRPDSNRGTPAGLRPERADFELSPITIRPKSGPEARLPARKPDFRHGSNIA